MLGTGLSKMEDYKSSRNIIVCLCTLFVLASARMQQYETPESGAGNIFSGGLQFDNAIPERAPSQQAPAESLCTFSFQVPSAQVQGLGCSAHATETNIKPPDMTRMHDNIIQLEERMIARDAYTRMEMKRLREHFQRAMAGKSLGAGGVNDESLSRANEEFRVRLSTVDTEVANMKALVEGLRRHVRHLEERVRSVDQSPDEDIKQIIRQGNCPPNFERYNQSCYAYYRDKRTWYKSQDFCQDLGGHLVSIESENEQNFIKDFLKDKGVRRDSFWIYAGGNDLDNDGEWTWIGSNHVIRHPEFWYSEVTPPPDTGFVCMFLYLWDPNNTAKWTKDRCDFQMPSVCEIPLVEADPNL